MNRFSRLTILSAMTLGLAACGGSAKLGGGKDGAAQAAFQASQPAGRGSKTGQALVEKALASGATNITLTANCAKSGKASLTLDATSTPLDGLINYSITYDACNEDGQNEYNGTMATSLGVKIDSSYTSGAFIIGMKGKLTITGEIEDFIDADVKLKMEFAATSASSGSVKLVVNGTIKTEDGNYAYTDSAITITAGELPKA
ncbi:hypothetical protein [Vitiosangium sp. GDMCC 1.1324]|uniref:hypothetical protein n=1 Tax=Vitiosangium sp. (strain GDMCC 1.1324) TaxID=2138576 RepID=UPI000D3423A9|nr:hypothetical protein [Vitiosangium sp. GDMCC 1.1324]PTL77762.1 hypothetical protein DAT35_41890 [Vitiosangium sp. GDMCC 1.1324]